MEPAYKPLTVGDFLDSCPNDQRHYQLLDGVIVAMAPPGTSHQLIAAILIMELGPRSGRIYRDARFAAKPESLPTGFRAGIISRRILRSPVNPRRAVTAESSMSRC